MKKILINSLFLTVILMASSSYASIEVNVETDNQKLHCSCHEPDKEADAPVEEEVEDGGDTEPNSHEDRI